MDTYVVRRDSQEPKLKQRAIWIPIFGGIFFMLMFGWKVFWPTSIGRSRGILSIALETGLVSLVWGLLMAYQPRKLPNYMLLVDDESITGVTQYTGWMKWFVMRRTISKGKVRSVWEIKGRLGATGGMGFSERSKWGARMLGFVFLPRSLPEYASLRALAESWRTADLGG